MWDLFRQAPKAKSSMASAEILVVRSPVHSLRLAAGWMWQDVAGWRHHQGIGEPVALLLVSHHQHDRQMSFVGRC